MAQFECDVSRLPYPVAITAKRLIDSLNSSADVLRTLICLKDCFEATIKFCGGVLLADYFRSSAANSERNALLIEKLGRPSLGSWRDVVRDLSQWLVESNLSRTVGRDVATLFFQPHAKAGAKPKRMRLVDDCDEFVKYRNESSFGHGGLRPVAAYEQELRDWLPKLGEFLRGVERLADWQLCLVTSGNGCSSWMGTEPGTVTETHTFAEDLCDHFVIRSAAGVASTDTPPEVTDLYPFLCYLPDREQQPRLHFYESIRNYRDARKEVDVLEYDTGFRTVSPVPIAGLERLFTADLLAKATKRQQGRMEIIEGRVAGFGELLREHADIVGRKFVIDAVKRIVKDNDRGLLVIEAEPGKGKTALMCHLIEFVFGNYSPQPIQFFYRRTAGITDPDVCVRTIYEALLQAHQLSESDEQKQKSSPEEMMRKLSDLLGDTIAPKLSQDRQQLILIDALDEAEKTSSGKDAFQRIPENLPKNVYVIVTTRHIQRRARLARRSDVHWYDLDSPDHLQFNLRDGLQFVKRELKDCQIPSATLKEINRIGQGNFLALKLIVNEVRATRDVGSVDDLLRRIATVPANEQLGSIYEDFWQRLTDRLEPHEDEILRDVAGLLVIARWPLSAEMICECLRLTSARWDFVLQRLREYLTAIEGIELEQEGEREAYYRIYHESFADFLRAKFSPDLRRLESILADYCRNWKDHAPGRGRLYSLRFAPEHLLRLAEHDPRRWNQLEELLTDIFFLEAKAQAGFVDELIADFSKSWQALPSDRPNVAIFKLLEEVIRRESWAIQHYVVDYPQVLFQCAWNLAWWYGNPAAAPYYERSTRQGKSRKDVVPGKREVSDEMRKLLDHWLRRKQSAEPGFYWLRSKRPPANPLVGRQLAVIPANRGGGWWVDCTADGKLLAGGNDPSLRIWNADTLTEVARMPEWEGQESWLSAAAISPDGRLLIMGGGGSYWTGTVANPKKRKDAPMLAVWDIKAGTVRRITHRHKRRIERLAFSPDGSHFATASEKEPVRIWETKSFEEIDQLDLDVGQFQSLCWSSDGKGVLIGIAISTSRDGMRIARESEFASSVSIYDSTSGALVATTAKLIDGVESTCFSPDGTRVVYVGGSGHVVVSDAITGATICDLRGHDGDFMRVCYLLDGKRIASGGGDGIRIWEVEDDASTAVLMGHYDDDFFFEFEHIAFYERGKKLLSASNASHCIWNGHDGRPLKEFQTSGWSKHSSDGQRCVEFSPSDDDDDAASLEVWNTSSGKVLFRHPWRRRKSCAFNLSPEGKVVAFTDLDRGKRHIVRVFDVARGRELAKLKGHEDEITHLCFSSDRAQIATASNDRTARVWDAATGELRARLLHKAAVQKVWFSPDGTQVATFGAKDGLRVFDTDGGIEYLVLNQNAQNIKDICFSPDGTRIIADAAGCIFVWNAKTGELLKVIGGHGDIRAIATDTKGESFHLLSHGVESPSGQIVAHYPHDLDHIATHPDGRTWAGAVGNYLALLHLEGGDNL